MEDGIEDIQRTRNLWVRTKVNLEAKDENIQYGKAARSTVQSNMLVADSH